jgi:hypothetical protein
LAFKAGLAVSAKLKASVRLSPTELLLWALLGVGLPEGTWAPCAAACVGGQHSATASANVKCRIESSS